SASSPLMSWPSPGPRAGPWPPPIARSPHAQDARPPWPPSPVPMSRALRSDAIVPRHQPGSGPAWRSVLVGRVSLWSFTLLALAFVAMLATGAAWLVLGSAAPGWLPHAHRVLLGLVFAAGAVLFVNLMVFYRFLVPDRDFIEGELSEARVHVVLTAFNDE